MTEQTKETAYYQELAARNLMGNYGERAIALMRGKGTRVWDTDGREYLDFLCGISVCSLGHCHEAVVQAIRDQAGTLMHCSNLYLIPQQAELAKRLCDISFADRCFFANTGAEVNEAAIKLARIWSKKKHGEGHHEIITMRDSFHGRTIATISATGQEKVQKGFEPLLEGFRYAAFNDLESVRARITDKTCAIMVEPVQGEGGVTAATPEFILGLREECDRRGLLLIFDEIQCGMARIGKFFAYEHYGVEPDILTLAKALGNGMPVGALLTRSEIAEAMTPGSHGTTFGGNPLAMAAALAVVDHMLENDTAGRAARMGALLREQITGRIGAMPCFAGLRGIGMMVGVALNHPGAEAVKLCMQRGLLINCTMGNVLRILPPLVATEEEIEQAIGILAEVLALPAAAGEQTTKKEGAAAEPAAAKR
jgi:acetylornithine/N-succinyldiaminopimelate aminotransferase